MSDVTLKAAPGKRDAPTGSFFIEIRSKALAIERFLIRYSADQSSGHPCCSVQWQHRRTRHSVISLVFLFAIALGVAAVIALSLDEALAQWRLVGATVAAIPLFVSVAITLSFYFDDRIETLRLFADRVEHQPVSRLSHYLLQPTGVEDIYEVAQTGHCGWITWIGFRTGSWGHRNSVRDAPVITLAQKPKLSFYAFGQAPECILVGQDVAMLIGPYLTQSQATHIAVACKRWIDGTHPRQIAVQLAERLQVPVNRDEVAWSLESWEHQLQQAPGNDQVLRMDDPLEVTIKHAHLMYHFSRDTLTIEETHAAMITRRIQIHYAEVQEIRLIGSGRLAIDAIPTASDLACRVDREGGEWLASLLSLRTGRPVRPSNQKVH